MEIILLSGIFKEDIIMLFRSFYIYDLREQKINERKKENIL